MLKSLLGGDKVNECFCPLLQSKLLLFACHAFGVALSSAPYFDSRAP